MIGLTQRQQQCLDFLRSYIGEHGIAPSFNEIAGALNLKAKSGVSRIINGLEERGVVRRVPNRARALEIVEPGTTYDPLTFLAPDVRLRVLWYAEANNMLPEVVIAARMREWAAEQAMKMKGAA